MVVKVLEFNNSLSSTSEVCFIYLLIKLRAITFPVHKILSYRLAIASSCDLLGNELVNLIVICFI